MPLVIVVIGVCYNRYCSKSSQGENNKRKKEREKKNHLLDIVKTAGFRFQYGSMMKHFIESNPKEDYIKLQRKKKGGWGLRDTAESEGKKVTSFFVTDELLWEISSHYTTVL